MVSWFTIKNEIIKKVLTRGLELFFSLAIKKSVGNSVENVCKAKIDFISGKQDFFFVSILLGR